MTDIRPAKKFDLFVSYAHTDDLAGAKDGGWVTRFVNDLKVELARKVGRQQMVQPWWDATHLGGPGNVTDEIEQALQNSSCLLAMLSPGYLVSDWCNLERSQFLKHVDDPNNPRRGRVFLVELDCVTPDRIPKVLSGSLRHKFWTGEPDTKLGTRPIEPERDKSEYEDAVRTLANGILNELARLAPPRQSTRPETGSNSTRESSRDVVAPLPATDRAVFLAEVTDDLRPKWKKLRDELHQRGITVLSPGVASDGEAATIEVQRVLAKASVFVQLLSSVPGQALAGRLETYACLQHRLAAAHGQTVVQWRSPQTTEVEFDRQEAEDKALAADHRKLLFGSSVRQEVFEDFRMHIVRLATSPPAIPVKKGNAFVTFSPELSESDNRLLNGLLECLKNSGMNITIPLQDEDLDPIQIRQDFDRAILGSRYCVVVYGETRQKAWVRGQLSEIDQLLCDHNRRAGAIHLCAGPPAPKDVHDPFKLLSMYLPRLRVIDMQSGFDEHRFLDSLNDLPTPATSAG